MKCSDYVVSHSHYRVDILKALFFLRCQDGFKFVQCCLQLSVGGTGSLDRQRSALRYSEQLRSHVALEFILSNLLFESLLNREIQIFEESFL